MLKVISSLVLFVFLAVSFSNAQEWVNGYTRQDGTYVPGYFRSSPNSTTSDNYSTSGNYNPYTGSKGTRNNDDYNSGSSYNSDSYNSGSSSTYVHGYYRKDGTYVNGYHRHK